MIKTRDQTELNKCIKHSITTPIEDPQNQQENPIKSLHSQCQVPFNSLPIAKLQGLQKKDHERFSDERGKQFEVENTEFLLNGLKLQRQKDDSNSELLSTAIHESE